MVLALILVGFAAGSLGSMLGVGGGLLMVPYLTLVEGVPFPTAVGISLVAVTATSVGATGRYFGKGLVDVEVGVRLEAATIMGVLAAEPLFRLLPPGALAAGFAALLALASWRMVRNTPGRTWEGEGCPGWTSQRRRWLSYGISAVAGSVGALLGVGGGILKVPVLTEVLRVNMHRAVATSTFMIGITAAAASTLAVLGGRVVLGSAAGLVLGVLPGAIVGSQLAPRVPQRILRRVFGMLLAVVAVMMIRRAL